MLGTSRVVAALLASVLLVSPALAQPAPTAAQKQQAQDLVKQAITKSQAKEHEAAIELYLKAYAVVPLPTLLSNVGTEYRAADKPVEALKYFCMYLDKDPTGTLQTYARAQARELQDTLGHGELEVCAPLPEVTPPVPDGTGTGDGTGVTGTTNLGATTGPPPASDPGKGMKIAGMVTGGLGVAALGAGVFFGLKAKRISDDITNQPIDEMWRTAIDEYEAEGQQAENFQIVSLIAGGALVTGGVILYVLGRSRSSSAERMTVAPTASADGGGLVLSGRF